MLTKSSGRTKVNEFSSRLREVRKDTGMSQGEVASEIGVTKSAYANYEQGIREPSLKVLKAICDALDVSCDYLLGRDDWL